MVFLFLIVMYGYCVFPSLYVPQFCLMNPKGGGEIAHADCFCNCMQVLVAGRYKSSNLL